MGYVCLPTDVCVNFVRSRSSIGNIDRLNGAYIMRYSASHYSSLRSHGNLANVVDGIAKVRNYLWLLKATLLKLHF